MRCTCNRARRLQHPASYNESRTLSHNRNSNQYFHKSLLPREEGAVSVTWWHCLLGSAWIAFIRAVSKISACGVFSVDERSYYAWPLFSVDFVQVRNARERHSWFPRFEVLTLFAVWGSLRVIQRTLPLLHQGRWVFLGLEHV